MINYYYYYYYILSDCYYYYHYYYYASIRPTQSLLHSKLGRIETSNPQTSAPTTMYIVYYYIITVITVAFTNAMICLLPNRSRTTSSYYIGLVCLDSTRPDPR